MDEFKSYFDPIDIEHLKAKTNPRTIVYETHFHHEDHFPDLENVKAVIIGIKEYRNCELNKGCEEGPDHVREEFYNLYFGKHRCEIADLGDLRLGHGLADTIMAISSISTELIKRRIIPIYIGGPQFLTYGIYSAFQRMERPVNVTSVDPKIDIGLLEAELKSDTYLSKIILNEPNYLFNYINIGYQTYLTEPHQLNLMERMHFETYRLGDVMSDIKSTEPLIRTCDIFSFDISAVRMSDAPSNALALPNGMYGEQACQLMRYAGLNESLKALGIFEYNPLRDVRNQTAKLIAQMMWCFIEALSTIQNDSPIGVDNNFTKYKVSLKEKHHLIFYKSKKTDRWWMEVPYPHTSELKYKKKEIVPCTYDDYQIACNHEMPQRWWKSFQRLSEQ